MNDSNPKPKEVPVPSAEPAASPEANPFLLGSRYEDSMVGVLSGLLIPPVLFIAGAAIAPWLGFSAVTAALVTLVIWYLRNPRGALFFRSCVLAGLIVFVALPLILVGACLSFGG
jgi:hypothetical protein